MTIEKTARATLTAVELDHGDELRFTLADGTTRQIRLVSTRATIDSTSRPYPLAGSGERPDLVAPEQLQIDYAARIVLRMHCTLEIDGEHVELVRWVGNQRSFSPPWEIAGMRIWFDAADALFAYLSENHGACRPRKAARFAVWEAGERICPPLLHPWCPLPPETLRIEECYAGSDCWMGPYAGAEAHGGLDINHPAGTPIWAPFSLDEQGLFNSLAAGDTNNRWRGVRAWDDGSIWTIGVHHVISVLPEQGTPVEAGMQIALGAGVAVGAYEHSHFTFGVTEPGDDPDREIVRLDPWLLFWQMYEDRRTT
jgi:hypothetical protein